MITRTAWGKKFRYCMVCGVQLGDLYTHENPHGVNRDKAVREPACWIRTCDSCHLGKHGLHDAATWPVARQLALKAQCDPTYYNLRSFIDIYRPDSTHEYAVELAAEVERFTREFWATDH